jgi:hypothetical protein
MQTLRLAQYNNVEVHRKIRWGTPGFRIRTKSATTAIFGVAKERIPGQKPTIVQSIAPLIWVSVSIAMCRPLPDLTAMTWKATAAQPKSYGDLFCYSNAVVVDNISETYHRKHNNIVVIKHLSHYSRSDEDSCEYKQRADRSDRAHYCQSCGTSIFGDVRARK